MKGMVCVVVVSKVEGRRRKSKRSPKKQWMVDAGCPASHEYR